MVRLPARGVDIFSKVSRLFLECIQPLIRWISVAPSLRPRSHVPVLDRRELTGRQKAQLGTLIISTLLTGRSNAQERCDQAVVHAQWSAMDRNSFIALFLLCCRRKRRRDRLHWVHPIIQKKGKNSMLCTHYLMNYEVNKTNISIIFDYQFHLSTGCVADWRGIFSVVTVKWGTAFNL